MVGGTVRPEILDTFAHAFLALSDCFATPKTITHQAFPSKNTGVGCPFLQGIFLTQGLNLSLLHW